MEQITFHGDRLTRDGAQPDDRKVQAIHEVKRPETKDVKRALGVINYLARYMPHQSTNCKVLRSLPNEDIAWELSTQHEKEWDEIKTFRTTKPVLAYFDPQKQI